jgi:protein O-mannosyl-transferase
MQQKTSKGDAGMQAPPAWLVGLLLVLITLALYWPVRHFEFNNYDDRPYVTENPYIQNGLTRAAIKWAFTAVGYGGNWHPLTWLSHLLDVQLFGLNAGGHHFTSVLFHTANTLLLFLLLRRWTGDLWRPAFVAALFGWHPLHVESVAWVAERKDVLSAFFWMLTLLAYGKYVEQRRQDAGNDAVGARVWWYYALSLVLFALGVMAKPMVVSLPLILLLLDYWPLRRIYDLRFAIYGSEKETANLESAGRPVGTINLGRAIVEKVPFFALAAASCLVTWVAQGRAGAIMNLSRMPAADRVGNALVSYAKYLGKVFWPVNLAVPYPYVHHLPAAEVAGAALLLLAISALSLRFARSHPPFFVGWLWFLITLVPVIGLVQVGIEPMADRYMYIPSIGIFVVLAWETPLLFKASSDDSLALPAAAIVLMGCLVLASAQISYWRNSLNLWTHTVQVTKNNPSAELNLAVTLNAEGRYSEALQHAREALRVRPDYPGAENSIGCTLSNQGKMEEAVLWLTAAIKSNPYFDQPYYNLGLAYMKMGRLDDALTQFQAFIRLNPQYPHAYLCLGDVLAKQGHVDEALDEYRMAFRLNPGDKLTLARLEQYQTGARNDKPNRK